MTEIAKPRVILTGASEGIGRALALALASRGARLVLAARDRERLETLAQECRARGAEARALPTDVTNQQDCEWLVADAVNAYGGIDVVIHNAGITMWSRFDALQDLGIFERLMEVNYLAPVRLTALSLPHLKQSKGLLVAVASLAGLRRDGDSQARHRARWRTARRVADDAVEDHDRRGLRETHRARDRQAR